MIRRVVLLRGMLRGSDDVGYMPYFVACCLDALVEKGGS